MKKILKKIIVAILQFEARLVIKKYQPRIIGVTGSVGKTSAKEAIFAVLSFAGMSGVRRVGKSKKSYNSEIGVPLAILGEETAWSSFFGWLAILFRGLWLVLRRDQNYPEILVLEMGVDRPGDIARLEEIVRVNTAVMTAIGEIPVHVEFFAGPEQVAKEKGKILRHLGVDDFAILNFDDATVYDLHDKTRGKVLTYGFGDGAMIRAANYQIMFQKDESGPPAGGQGPACAAETIATGRRDIPLGVSFKIDYDGHTVPMRLHGSFGKQQVYAALAAAAVGIAYGMNLVEVSEALSRHVSPPGRLKLIEGIKHSWLLDDTYNSSPVALHAALDTLHDIPAKRRIAVLGDMLELGKYTIEAHKDIGRRVKTLGIDTLFVVGPRSKFIAQEARELGMPQTQIFEFSDAREAGPALKDLIEEGDVVLLKGSQSMRIERVVEEAMAHPESAASLLIRQDKFWKN
ncbi:MAG: hypothetical protein HZA25_02415 [Candidatus Niyogibacteria bacterium]|nr:hypothetical protein [Candidatus Niyogibacteria bacterium]